MHELGLLLLRGGRHQLLAISFLASEQLRALMSVVSTGWRFCLLRGWSITACQLSWRHQVALHKHKLVPHLHQVASKLADGRLRPLRSLCYSLGSAASALRALAQASHAGDLCGDQGLGQRHTDTGRFSSRYSVALKIPPHHAQTCTDPRPKPFPHPEPLFSALILPWTCLLVYHVQARSWPWRPAAASARPPPPAAVAAPLELRWL